MANHDIIVLGCSYGGVEALAHLCRSLPETLPAAVFGVLHLPGHVRSSLPVVISNARVLDNGMRAFHALEGAHIEYGKMYIAPPDHHLILRDSHMRLVRGPRENGNRPAIDPLFRSAAHAFGPRVIGVVMTGFLDDGTAGLHAVKQRGGIAVVQDPDDAVEGSMPRNAIENVKVDHIVRLADLPALLQRLVQEPSPPAADYPISSEMDKEVRIDELDAGVLNNDRRPGKPSPFSCPDCGGVLWQIEDGNLVRYRCRVGHAFSTESVQVEQSNVIENAMWTALKVLEEKATMLRQLIARSRAHYSEFSAGVFEERLKLAESRAEVLRRALLSGNYQVNLPDAGVASAPPPPTVPDEPPSRRETP